MTAPTLTSARLLRHDLLLTWRDLRGAFRSLGPRGLCGLSIMLAFVMHVAAWAATQRLDAARVLGGGAEARLVTCGVVFVLLLMTAQSLNGATQALYGRGDLDLLVSSPLSARALLVVRALAIACNAGLSAAIFVVPLVDVGIASGDLSRLAFLPTLCAGALAAVALGLATAVALVWLLGPKRARLGAQILATFIGGGFMQAVQFSRLWPARGPGVGGDLPLQSLTRLVRLPAHAALGEPRALALWCAGCVAAFLAVTLLLGPHFIAQAMVAPAAEATRRVSRHRRRPDRPFRTGRLTAIRRKEWRIVLRDPWIVSQILLQLLYITPLFAVLWHGGGRGSPVLALASTVVVVSYQLAASLTWLGVSGEDAVDLIAGAPVTHDTVRAAKIQAVAGITALVVGPLLLWLLWLSPAAAMRSLALAALAGLSAVALNLWHGRPARRGTFAARHRESKLLALIEMAMAMLLGVLAVLVVIGSGWMVVPLGAVALILLANRPRRHRALLSG